VKRFTTPPLLHKEAVPPVPALGCWFSNTVTVDDAGPQTEFTPLDTVYVYTPEESIDGW
jgi:hypothetical protein